MTSLVIFLLKLLESVLQQNEGTNQKEEDVAQESRNAAQGRSAGNGQISGERRFIHPRMTTVLLPCPDGSPRTAKHKQILKKKKAIAHFSDEHNYLCSTEVLRKIDLFGHLDT